MAASSSSRGRKWSEVEEDAIIRLRAENDDQFEAMKHAMTKKSLWARIHGSFVAETGSHRTRDEIRCKFKSLMETVQGKRRFAEALRKLQAPRPRPCLQYLLPGTPIERTAAEDGVREEGAAADNGDREDGAAADDREDGAAAGPKAKGALRLLNLLPGTPIERAAADYGFGEEGAAADDGIREGAAADINLDLSIGI